MTTSYSLFKSKFKLSIAQSIYNEIISKTSRYFHFLGKENAWTDFLSPFIPSSQTDVPGPPQDNFRYELHVRRDILTTKLITPADVSYIVPRYNWTSGEVYDMYDDAITATDPAYSGAIRLEEAKFYVVTTDYNVYKCISNNYNSISTIMPSGTSTSTFATADGYLWKFLYTIPLSLRTRFLSSDYIPVTTALTAQFYDNGALSTITIDNGGNNYTVETVGGGTISTSTSSIAVNGTSTHFTTYVQAGYDIKKLNGDVIGTVVNVVSDTLLQLDSNAAYTLTDSSYVITPPVQVSATVIGDGYLENNPVIFSDVTITEAGAGYLTTPNVTVSAPTVISGSEQNGDVSITMSGEAIDTASVSVAGYGYADAPTITVDPPISGANAWVANHSYSLSDKISYNGNFYTVTNPGTSSTTPPSHTTGDELNGTATLAFSGTQAVLTAVKTKTEAQIHVVVDNGVITNVVIDDAGIAYTTASISISDPNGSGAQLTPYFNTGNVDTLQANVELLAVPGTIEVIKMVNQGTNYTTATVAIIGDGEGALASANISGGAITSITMDNVGHNYTWTDVQITGDGSGAVARAIMSPITGHGKNAIDELNANSIAFYSAITQDINQGLINTNDYRKAGLLKDLKQFGSQAKFTDDIGSGCILITGNFTKANIDYDMLLVDSVHEYKHYRVVEFTDTQILISVFNNFSINIGDTLLTPNGDPVLVTAVQERTIDQFSGELLFLTVREPYAPAADQLVTIKTIVTI